MRRRVITWLGRGGIYLCMRGWSLNPPPNQDRRNSTPPLRASSNMNDDCHTTPTLPPPPPSASLRSVSASGPAGGPPVGTTHHRHGLGMPTRTPSSPPVAVAGLWCTVCLGPLSMVDGSCGACLISSQRAALLAAGLARASSDSDNEIFLLPDDGPCAELRPQHYGPSPLDSIVWRDGEPICTLP
jgi:hypothetical protein